jgi:hypothetical protein
MTTLKKASALFLSIVLSDYPYHFSHAIDRILYFDTNLDLARALYRFTTMDEKLRHFGDLIERQSQSGPANHN